MQWNSSGLNMEDVRNLVFKVQEVLWQQIKDLSCWIKILLRCVWVGISSAIAFLWKCFKQLISIFSLFRKLSVRVCYSELSWLCLSYTMHFVCLNINHSIVGEKYYKKYMVQHSLILKTPGNFKCHKTWWYKKENVLTLFLKPLYTKINTQYEEPHLL